MSNPTTPFSWQMPTATDLVTDLPADFEVFGQAVATSMADLLGGTSGQILAKNSNTDMDFVWVTNDVGDITAVTAGTGISGGGTSGAVTITNSMATTIDAKGDLIVGTGADAFARLAVGATNGMVLTVDSAEATGLKYATPATSGFVGVSLYHAAFNISLTNATTAKMTWTNGEEQWDTSAFHDGGTGTRITIPAGKGGYYLVNFGVAWDANANNRRVANILKNNTDNLFSVETTSGTTYYPSLYGSYVVSLAVADYIEVQVYQDSGGTINAGKSVFQAIYLGA